MASSRKTKSTTYNVWEALAIIILESESDDKGFSAAETGPMDADSDSEQSILELEMPLGVS